VGRPAMKTRSSPSKSSKGRRRVGRALVGTSGWSYDHWKGVFYPQRLAKARWFAFLAERFPTVEVNATYYRLFPERTFQSWAAKAPRGFVYAVKMWKRVTHERRLRDVEEPTAEALTHAALLGDHLGPILVQLPPGLRRDDGLLAGFLELLDRLGERADTRFCATVEFRHASWFDDAVYELLRRAGVALCLFDSPRLTCPRVVTAGFVYVRFHGRPKLFASLYPESALRSWARWLGEQRDAGRDVFVYFNNDVEGHAITNAGQLTEMLNRP